MHAVAENPLLHNNRFIYDQDKNTRLNLDSGRALRYYTLTRAPTALVAASGWA
jgi:hypothetical protein